MLSCGGLLFGSWNATQVVSLGDKYFYLLYHLTSLLPLFLFLLFYYNCYHHHYREAGCLFEPKDDPSG